MPEDQCQISMAGFDGKANRAMLSLYSVLPNDKKSFHGLA